MTSGASCATPDASAPASTSASSSGSRACWRRSREDDSPFSGPPAAAGRALRRAAAGVRGRVRRVDAGGQGAPSLATRVCATTRPATDGDPRARSTPPEAPAAAPLAREDAPASARRRMAVGRWWRRRAGLAVAAVSRSSDRDAEAHEPRQGPLSRTGFTKGDLIGYYAAIAPVLLPHLRDRPLTLKRYPDGVEGEHFYEKQCPSHRPDWVQNDGRLERARRARDRLLPVPGPADARVAGEPRRHRAASIAVAGGASSSGRRRSPSTSTPVRRRASSSAARSRCSCATCSPSWGCRRSPRPRARRACRSTCRSTTTT